MRVLPIIAIAFTALWAMDGRATGGDGPSPDTNPTDPGNSERSSLYRASLVRSQEASRHLGHVTEIMDSRQARCPSVQQLLPAFRELKERAANQLPLQDLPSEQELNYSPRFGADLANADACDESANVVRRMIDEKKAKVTAAGQILQSRYGDNRTRADQLVKILQRRLFEATCERGGRTLRDPGRLGALPYEHLRYFVHEGAGEYKQAYDDVASALFQKMTFLRAAEARLDQTFANHRCATAGSARPREYVPSSAATVRKLNLAPRRPMEE